MQDRERNEKYIIFRAGNTGIIGSKYRLNKETGEVQDGTYHNVLKGLYVDLDDK